MESRMEAVGGGWQESCEPPRVQPAASLIAVSKLFASKAGILWIRPRPWVEYQTENASIAFGFGAAWSRAWSKSKASRATRAHLARWIMPAGSRSFCPQAGYSCATARPSRKHCSSAASRQSRHSGGNMEAGALISYGFDLMGLFYDIASYVHQIARGAKPSDMPIEQSPRFYMAVNLKTAASL